MSIMRTLGLAVLLLLVAVGCRSTDTARGPGSVDAMAFEVVLDEDLDAAVATLTAALKNEGFGVLTRIDVHTTLKEKIGVEFQPYAILGVCRPSLAHRALTRDSRAGLMLPCPVTVEQLPQGGSLVRIGDPETFMELGGFGGDEVMESVAGEAHDRLKRAALALAAS